MGKPDIVQIDVIAKEDPGEVQKFILLVQEHPNPVPRRVTMEDLDQELLDLEERKQEVLELKEQLNQKVFEVLKEMKEGT